jgi:hypothetical protein
MLAAISTYGVTDIDDLSDLVREQYLPIVESVPGFVASTSSTRETAAQGPRRSGALPPKRSHRRAAVASTVAPAAVRTIVPPGARFA